MRQVAEGGSSFAVIQSTFAGVFAMIALVLAATGIYGLVAYRTRYARMRSESAKRRVLLRLDVLKLILIQGLWLTVWLVRGLALAFALTRAVAAQLYGVSATDPMDDIGGCASVGGDVDAGVLSACSPSHANQSG